VSPWEIVGQIHWTFTSVGVVSTLLFSAALLWRRRAMKTQRYTGELPGISILKPFDGHDPDLEDNFWNTCTAPYPAPRQILFATAHDNAAGIATVRRIQARALELPGVEVDLVLPAASEEPWVTRKAWHMQRAWEKAAHAVVVNSDSGTRLGDDTLEELVRTLLGAADRGVAWASYTLVEARSIGAKLTRLAWTSSSMCFFVVDATRALMGRGGLSAAGLVAFRAEVLDAIGGFAAGEGYVTEDLPIGYLIAENGWTLAASPSPVVRHMPDISLAEFWGRQLRWNVVLWAFKVHIRWPYPLVLGGLAVVPFSWAVSCLVFPDRAFEYSVLGGALVLSRWVWALALSRLSRAKPGLDIVWLMPLLDALLLASWAKAAFVRTVTWRGRVLRLTGGGRVVPEP
jgi:cellulose synthase/poly-beta-1,6-N-acetylglucosamine synthase-like glycosyltransferase